MSILTAEQEIQLRIAALEAAALITAHHAQHVEVTDYADHCLEWLKRGEFARTSAIPK
jgi:hypothetical protein